MNEVGAPRPAQWDGFNISRLLALDPVGPNHWRASVEDANMNGRSYGGQLLGQTMMAAVMGMPSERQATMMQFLFLQGALPDEPLELQVTELQRGKRFTSCNVRGFQANGRTVLDAQVTSAIPLDAPHHGSERPELIEEDPKGLPTLDDVDPAIMREISRMGGYSQDRKPSIEFRIPHAERQLGPATSTDRFRFWMRASPPLPDDPRVQTAAFAYLSDWWLNFSALLRIT
jgi:acyl-CoA thioesterase-2